MFIRSISFILLMFRNLVTQLPVLQSQFVAWLYLGILNLHSLPIHFSSTEDTCMYLNTVWYIHPLQVRILLRVHVVRVQSHRYSFRFGNRVHRERNQGQGYNPGYSRSHCCSKGLILGKAPSSWLYRYYEPAVWEGEHTWNCIHFQNTRGDTGCHDGTTGRILMGHLLPTPTKRRCL